MRVATWRNTAFRPNFYYIVYGYWQRRYENDKIHPSAPHSSIMSYTNFNLKKIKNLIEINFKKNTNLVDKKMKE